MITHEGALQLIDYLLSLGARGDDNETAIANDTLAGLFDDYRAEIEAAAEQRGMEQAVEIVREFIQQADTASVLEVLRSVHESIRNAKEA